MARRDAETQMDAKRQKAATKMPRRPLGDSGIDVSTIALGCFAFGGDRKTGTHLGAQMTALHNGVWGEQSDEDTYATVKAALDAGINFFDNAEMYGDGYAEQAMGEALRRSGYARSEYVIATKVSESLLEPKLLRERLDGSLKRIGVKYIDLYQARRRLPLFLPARSPMCATSTRGDHPVHSSPTDAPRVSPLPLSCTGRRARPCEPPSTLSDR